MVDETRVRYGVAAPEEIAGLTGQQILDAMRDGRLPAPMARTFAFRLVEIGEGAAVFEGEPSGALLNPMGAVHGG